MGIFQRSGLENAVRDGPGTGEEGVGQVNEQEFDEFYDARFSSLVRAVYLQTGDVARAEDCVQEAFVRAWQQRRRLRGDDPVRWVYRVAFRLAVSQWRRTRREITVRALPDSVVPLSGPPPEDLVTLHHVLRRLTSEHRSVIVLHHLNDLAVNDVALVLGIPQGTVKSRLSRAREQLREHLQEETT